MKTDLFHSCGHYWIFQICWHIECSTFTASSSKIWNSSTGMPWPPLALIIVMLSKAHLTSHSRMLGLGKWSHLRDYLGCDALVFHSSSVYSCHLFLLSCASVRSIPFLSFIEPIFAWNGPLVSVIFFIFFLNFILFLNWTIQKIIIFLFNFTILYWFCHISKWILHRYTCVPHPEPSSLLPPHIIPLGHPSAPAPSIQYCASNLDWRLVSYMILYIFQYHSPKIIPSSPSPTESKRLFYTSVSLLLSRIQGYYYHLSKFYIYAIVYYIGVFLSGLLHSV